MSPATATVRLGDPDVANVILGQSPPSSTYNEQGIGLPFYQGKADFGLVHPTPRVWCTEGNKFAKPGDVLMSVRAPVGDVNMATESAVVGRGVSAIRAAEGMDPWYLYFSLTFMKPILEAQATGSTFASVNGTTLRDLEIPFVPLQDQVAIGRSLRFLLTRIQQEEAALSTTSETKRSAMQQLFSRGLRGESQKETEIGPVPDAWDVITINDVALKTQYGLSVRGQAQGQIPILRMNCQDDGRVRFRELQYVDLDEATLSAFRLEDGDLLFNRTNSIEHVGRTAIFEGSREAVFASYLVRLTVDASRCLPRFLNYYMNRREVQHDIKRLASRAVGQANINATKLRTVTFPLPPSLDEQAEIIAILDVLDLKIDLHRRKRDVLDQLLKSLLHQLMTGEVSVEDLDLSALPANDGSAA